jgi:hypothetical protein
MSKTMMMTIGITAILTATAATAQDGFPITAKDPDGYYDMARLYWREASPEVRRKCVGQVGHLTGSPMQYYVTLEACLETWTGEENYSKRPHTFNAR